MSSARKSNKSSTTKKPAASKSAAVHPSWTDMIKECITEHREEARSGVSRPQIKKYVEAKYKIQIGAAQTSQLNRAIANGAEKGTFVLPKGLSGKVKLPPKRSIELTAAKENKPVKPVAKPRVKAANVNKTKPAPKKTTTVAKKSSSAKLSTKSSTTAKKVPAKAKKPETAKRASSVKKAPAKKTVTGNTRARATTTKSRVPAKKVTKAASTRKVRESYLPIITYRLCFISVRHSYK
ncbi:hypothetical protein M0805_003029 [Coniferiporia weirii]|nr:hypothetical protein M0805_003029 [Coniferiporia weirii]